jgi:tetrahydromethanopterin S-methyltransferase subunit F
MTSREQHETIWVVVKASRGIPAIVEAYRDRQSAYAREQMLRMGMNEEYDETDVFEIQIKDTVQ